MLLTGKTAIVTGASRGIGLEIARALAGAGATVAMLARGAESLQARAAEIGAAAIAAPCDVGDPSSVDRAMRTWRERFGGAPDILVSNAGAFPLAPIEQTDVAAFADTLRTNVVGPFAFLRAVLAPMRARGRGHVVTIGSIADRATFPENAAYAASKFAVRALHQVAREELRGSGVRATLVSPGPVDTSLWDPVDPDTREGFTPRAEMLRPEAVADAVVWVVTRDATVNVDELRLSRA